MRLSEIKLNESVSGLAAWELLEQLGDAINIPLVRPHMEDVVFDKAEVANAAIQIMHSLGEGDRNSASNICYSLFNIRTNAKEVAGGSVKEILNAKRTLEDHDFTPFHELGRLFDAASTFNTFANNVIGNIEMILEVVDFLENVYGIATKGHGGAHKVSFCRATLKHLGILR